MPPDVYYVLAWNFKKEILANNRALIEPAWSSISRRSEEVADRCGILVTGASGFLGTGSSPMRWSAGDTVVRARVRGTATYLHGGRSGALSGRPLPTASTTSPRGRRRETSASTIRASSGSSTSRSIRTSWIGGGERQPQAKLIAWARVAPTIRTGTGGGELPCRAPDREPLHLRDDEADALRGPARAAKQFGLRYLQPGSLHPIRPRIPHGRAPDALHLRPDPQDPAREAPGRAGRSLGRRIPAPGVFYVDDFVRTALRLSEECENDTVNVGAGEEHPIRRFAEMICTIIGYDPGSIRYDTTKYVGARSKCLDTVKLGD